MTLAITTVTFIFKLCLTVAIMLSQLEQSLGRRNVFT
jgi:hypothetical protein